MTYEHDHDHRLDRKIDRSVGLTRAAMAWERVWPAIAPPIGVLLLFVAASWIGLWGELGETGRIVALVAFALLLLASLWRLARLTLPRREEAMKRLEADAVLVHRPLTAYRDRLANRDGHALTAAVWQYHRRRAAAALSAIAPRRPRPELFRHDPWGLRAALALLLVVGFAVADGAHWERLTHAFRFATPAESAVPARVDAWVTPPDYTGRPPLFLSAVNRTETANGIAVPEGSVFTLRAQGADDLALTVTHTDGVAEPVALAAAGPEGGAPPAATGPGRIEARTAEIVIDRDLAIDVAYGGSSRHWRFVSEPDRPPSIALLERPKPNLRGGFEVRYETDDDHGIRSAEARLALVDPPQRDAATPARPLFDAPDFALSLPGGSRGRGAGRTVKDLSSHPWAGSMVEMTLAARDHRDQEGLSEPVAFRLPARRFVQPLARALIEQRRILALDANSQARVIDALDSLLLYPDGIFQTAGEFLAVRQGYKDLVAAHTDDELRGMVEKLWDLAVMIEDGALSDAERALQAAQEALRQALQEGASDEEIARLTQELREAMNRYLQELARQAQQNPQVMPFDPGTQMLTSRDLDEMLRRIEELAKSGSREQAEQLLSELQRMLQNLQAGRPMTSPDGAMGEMGKMLDELGKMIQRQQELMDETHDLQRRQQQAQRGQQGQQGQMTPQELAEALRRLQQGQGDLQQRLKEMMQALQDQGLEPGEQMGQAGRSMGRAEQQLGEGQPGRAVGPQGEAIEALRQGAQQLAQQMQQMMMGQGDQPGDQFGSTRTGQDRDPLGRFRRNDGTDITSRVQIPDEIDVQRARRILEQLRERLGERFRPQFELDYLERLLPRD